VRRAEETICLLPAAASGQDLRDDILSPGMRVLCSHLPVHNAQREDGEQANSLFLRISS